MKWAIFDHRSITTHNSVQLFDRGRSVMKCMAIDCHGAYGSSRGDRSPYLLWRRDLSLWLSEHACIYFSIWESIPGHQKFRQINSMVLSCLVLTTVPQTAAVRTDRTEPPWFGSCLGEPRTAQPPHGSVSWQTTHEPCGPPPRFLEPPRSTTVRHGSFVQLPLFFTTQFC